MVKSSLICEQDLIHKLWLAFQPSVKLYVDDLVKVVALFECDRGKDHHHAKSSISVTLEYWCLWKLHVHSYMGFAEQHRAHCLPCHVIAAYIL